MKFYIGRYKNIERKTYNFEVITPMFLGGADPKNAELRVSSVKGMLRFWWRAISGIQNIKELKEKENEIFGSTDEKSKVKINVIEPNVEISKDLFKGKILTGESKEKFRLDILHYLAFGAIVHDKNIKGNKVDKEYITPNSKFQLEISTPDRYFKEIDRSLRYFITFGNIGAKSRNGFGSLFSENISYIDKLDFSNDFFDYTSFSKDSRFIRLDEKESWNDALSLIGLIYREARLSIEKRHSFEKRGLIAKPIEAKNEDIPNNIKNERHSKPYFFHVNKLNNGKYQGQILYLPYNYYQAGLRNKYFEVLEQMNNKIEELAGGNKWQ